MAKRINRGQIRHEENLIHKAGYVNWKEKSWHWVITKPGSKVVVHVWPTTGKYMVDFDSGASLYENDLLGCLERAFKPMIQNAEQTEAETKLQDFRTSFSQDLFDGDT